MDTINTETICDRMISTLNDSSYKNLTRLFAEDSFIVLKHIVNLKQSPIILN